jgi:hypothetical protein
MNAFPGAALAYEKLRSIMLSVLYQRRVAASVLIYQMPEGACFTLERRNVQSFVQEARLKLWSNTTL